MNETPNNLFDFEASDEHVMPFGKYCGEEISTVAEQDPRYLGWFRTTDWAKERPGVIDAAIQAAAVAKVDAAPELTLTDHQSEVVGDLQAAMGDGHPIVRLEGGAGYGKSYAAKAVVRDLIKDGYEVAATAVSYVATQVLAGQLDPYGVTSATLARTLKFSKTYDDRGNEVYDHSENTAEAVAGLLSEGHALVVDECSMINNRDAVLLANAAKAGGGRLVLIGDSAQLPPVRQETLSMCCTRVVPEAVATLTVPMRYDMDSALFAVEQAVREDPWSALKFMPVNADEVTAATDADALVDQYVSNYRNDPTALHRMLLFRRKEVVAANARIRRKEVVAANARIRRGLFGENADVVEDDEQLMIMSTGDTPYVRYPQPGDQTRYYSGQMFRVTDREQSMYSIDIAGETFKIPHYRARFDNGRPPVRLMFSVSEFHADPDKLGGPEFTAALKHARDYGLAEDEYGQKIGSWQPYRQLQNDFVRVAYTYATSVHRAQGQTCDYAYCHPGSLLQVPGIMGHALTYVAMTRARKHLSVVV